MKIKNKTFPAVILGIISNLSICFSLIFIFSFLFSKASNFPEFALEPITLTITGAGAFVGGYVCGKIKQQNGMFFGMICAFIAFILIFLLGLILKFENITLLTLIRLLLMLICAAVGGIIGVNNRK